MDFEHCQDPTPRTGADTPPEPACPPAPGAPLGYVPIHGQADPAEDAAQDGQPTAEELHAFRM